MLEQVVVIGYGTQKKSDLTGSVEMCIRDSTSTMRAIPGMMFLLGIYCAGGYGGSVSAILINTPGTPCLLYTARCV